MTRNTEASPPLQLSSALPQIIVLSLTNPCVYSTDELFKASAYFTDTLLPSLDTNSKRSNLTGLFTHLEPPASVLDISTPGPLTSTSTLLPPITLAPGLVSPSTVSRSPLSRAQPVIRRLLSRPKLSGTTDDRLFSFPVSPQNIPTSGSGPVFAPTAFNLSQRTSLPYWTWLETPENSSRLARFARAMAGTEGWMGASDAELRGKVTICFKKQTKLLTCSDSLSVSRASRRCTYCRRWRWDWINDIETC